MIMRLTKNFTLSELTQSAYAKRHQLDNSPPPAILKELILTAQLLQKIRDYLSFKNGRDTPLVGISGYRSPTINRGVGGSAKSDHLAGMAADFNAVGMTAFDVCKTLLPQLEELGIGQLINEGAWVHVSRKAPVRKINRVITIDKFGARVGIVQVRL
jgi:zinc D-Ala-D-Ala carboxypeptidase